MPYTPGDHLVAFRFTYTHHGLYVGQGKVIHYLRAGVTEASVDEFAAKMPIRVRDHEQRAYSRSMAVRRAYARLHECEYNLVFNNCEHFVLWCIDGAHRSRQVEKVARTLDALLAAYRKKKSI